jgi:hypothetical protein
MTTQNRRTSSIDRALVQSILTSGTPAHAASPPSPHVGSSPNRDYSVMTPPPQPPAKHTRAVSYNPRRLNRLSLSFPVATSTNGSESARPVPTSSNPPSFPATSADAVPTSSPSDTNSFLVALAAQERRVLELKEELQKAEADLFKLKKKWAYHGAQKKRADIRHVEPLQPLQTVVMKGDSSNEESDTASRQSIELDRRKVLLSNIHKEPRGKVLTGGHTRTLSLLSPDRANCSQLFPPVQESESESDTRSLTRSTTMPDTSQGITKISSNRARHTYQGGVTHNAKQIAEDVKAGLWTFLEDLRQATVGDEAVSGTTNRASLDTAHKDLSKKGSKSSLLSNERGRHGPSPGANMPPRTWDSLTGSNTTLLDAVGTLWPDIGHLQPALKPPAMLKPTPTKSLSLAPAADDFDDDWSNWDSPTPKSPRWSGSELTDPATPSHSINDDRSIK